MSQDQAVELDIGSKPNVKEVELVFTNITPYYGGRHTPKTIYCLDENCSTIAYALPSVSSIKGVARWFLRTVLAYYIDPEELSKKGYASVEEQPHIDDLSLLEYIFGTTREIAFDKKRLQGFSGVLQIHVRTEFTRDQLYIHWDEINAIFRHIEEVIPDISKGIHQALTIVGSRDLRGKDHKLDRLVNTLVNVLVVCIPRLILEYLSRESARDIPRLLGKLYRDLRKAGLSRNVMSVLDSAVSSLSEALKHVFNNVGVVSDYIRLFEIPRIRLLAQEIPKVIRDNLVSELSNMIRSGKVSEKGIRKAISDSINTIKKLFFEIQPLREDSIKLHVLISVSPRADIDDERILKLSALLIIVSLGVLGLGKCVTRGFGRFRLAELRLHNIGYDDFWKEVKEKGSDINWIVTRAFSVIHTLANEILINHGISLEPSVIGPVDIYVTPPFGDRIAFNPVSSKKVDTRSTLMRIHILDLDRDKIRKPFDTPKGVEKLECRDLLDILSAIGCSCLKIYWKHFWLDNNGRSILESLKFRPDIKAQDLPGIPFHTIVLGLPRSIRRGRDITGYQARVRENKHAKSIEHYRSPIILFPWRNNDEYQLVIIGWLINDLARENIEEISHYSIHKVNRDEVHRVYDIRESIIEHVIKTQNISKQGTLINLREIAGVAFIDIDPSSQLPQAKHIRLAWDPPLLINYAIDTILSILKWWE